MSNTPLVKTSGRGSVAARRANETGSTIFASYGVRPWFMPLPDGGRTLVYAPSWFRVRPRFFPLLRVLEHLHHPAHALRAARHLGRRFALGRGDQAHEVDDVGLGEHLDVDHGAPALRIVHHERLHVRGDERVVAAGGERGGARDLELVHHLLHVGEAAHGVLDLLLHLLRRRFAREQHAAVVAGRVHVRAREALAQPREHAPLDVLVLDVDARRAPVGHHHRAPGHGGDRERGAALLQEGGREQHGKGEADAFHFLSPKITLSTTSHRQWITRRWISWTRMVRGCATLRWWSVGRSIFAIAPPSRPVSAITTMFFSCAALIASITFLELPEVEMPSRTSPGCPSAWTCLEKTLFQS